MWPSFHFPSLLWPDLFWPIPNGWEEQSAAVLGGRALLREQWVVALVAEDGTEYELGTVDVRDGGALTIPASVPNGTYEVKVSAIGIGWRDLISKPTKTIKIDRTASEPITDALPVFSNLRYDIFQGWLRLLWDGDVPGDSGMVSAGIWLSDEPIDFSVEPDVTIPLFPAHTTHSYLMRLSRDPAETRRGIYWRSEVFEIHYWPTVYWLSGSAILWAGVAPISPDGTVGDGVTVALPDRAVGVPISLIYE